MENIMNITHHRRARALSGGLWHDIKVNTADGEFHAFALVFKEGSKYGIGNGRVSKLSIVGPDGVNCYEYDRAPMTPPQSKMAGLVADYIVEMFDIHNEQ